jgi:hypothetical protein
MVVRVVLVGVQDGPAIASGPPRTAAVMASAYVGAGPTA